MDTDIQTIVVPSISGKPLAIDMTSVRQASVRLDEIQMVNNARAPELLALFNRAYLDVGKYLSMIEFEVNKTTQVADQVKAVFLIDQLPAILQEKGLATARSPLGSEDIRQAFLARHVEYQQYQDRLIELESYRSLFKHYQRSFENAYNSVKKLLDSDTSWRPNANLPQPLSIQSPNDDDFFGRPK